ncbi:Microcin C7 self-immunity protein MccF [Streptomyces sp. RB5]|uniref:Microcin C7 self-immunity protein MccF n=1 Tax=Streptomyces smaragdinus TaxID=2585196 RepID=A0A7K0CI58_9ACTN|nr:Microcin C7 self-immunity protein MccF [Streptomyces smaragdinus]
MISPSFAGPAVFPRPFETGLGRLVAEFGLRPVEYATTRAHATPAERAADVNAAFADPSVKAVFASIGGEDQITVLPYLDCEVIRANPKPFFGMSDNTSLLLYLWNTGIVGYHGGLIMTTFGRPHGISPLSADSVRAALFGPREYELRPAPEFKTVDQDWAAEETWRTPPPMEPGTGWIWHRPDRVVEGVSWGGCVEILAWHLMADSEIQEDPAAYDGCVLFLETSEEMPPGTEIYRTLRNMGERGLLRRFPALLWGRPKTWAFDRRNEPAERARYATEQREAVLRALAEYAPGTMAVFDVDFGHTDPQLTLPYGGRIRVDGPARRISVTY